MGTRCRDESGDQNLGQMIDIRWGKVDITGKDKENDWRILTYYLLELHFMNR